MKTKIISLLMALGIVGVLQVQAQISWINNTSGTISISQSQYVNNMNQSWYINASSSSYEFLQITVQSVETERNYDFLSIFSVDNNGNILSTEMIASGAVGTIRIIPSVPTKRFMVRFKSDSSNNGSSPGYGGFTLSYLTTNSSATVDSYVSGNAYVSGSLQTTSLLVSGYSSFSGPSTYFNSNYNYFSGVNYINGDSYLSKVGIGTSSLLKQLNVGGDSYFDGNVGIKTSDPKVTLDVNGSVYLPSGNSYWLGSYSNSGNRLRMHHNGTDAYIDYQPNLYLRSGTTTRMTLLSNGNVGIGTTDPQTTLEVNGEFRVSGSGNEGKSVIIHNSSKTQAGQAKEWKIWNMTGTTYGNSLQFWAYDQTGCSGGLCSSRLTIMDNGNVGIGISNPTNKLEVNGIVRAKEFRAETTGWPDYVFAPDYQLPSLETVSNHIKEHKHLPDIPSAQEVAEQGINLSEMQAKLLQKIEELTLYIIQQNEKIENLETKVMLLEDK